MTENDDEKQGEERLDNTFNKLADLCVVQK
jgi:hypothetical protein